MCVQLKARLYIVQNEQVLTPPDLVVGPCGQRDVIELILETV